MKTTLALSIALGLIGWGSASWAEPPEACLGTFGQERARFALAGNQAADSLSAGSMLLEIKAVVDSFRTVEERLQAEFSLAVADSTAPRQTVVLANLDLARKRRIMEIQIRHARREGRINLARRIDTSLMALNDQLPEEPKPSE